jgi:hypothetical protein
MLVWSSRTADVLDDARNLTTLRDSFMSPLRHGIPCCEGDMNEVGGALVPVVAGLEGAAGVDAEVLGLLVGELGELHAERAEVQRATFSSRCFGST